MSGAQKEAAAFSHSGVVTRVEGNSVVVTLDEDLHCESCRARGACGIASSPNRQVEIRDASGSFSPRERVEVLLRKDLGHKAVLWAYVFPFILMVFTLLATSLFLPEWMAGLLALLVLAPYYGLVYLLKGQFRKAFEISILRK